MAVVKCPVCRTRTLRAGELDRNLRTLDCVECGGHWVQAFQYWQWVKKQDGRTSAPVDPGPVPPVTDSEVAKLCPECAHILLRAKVGRGLRFYLDRCGHCGGLWLDRHEWENLKARGLHDDMHFVFSQAWQSRVAEEEHREAVESRYRKVLGAEDYAEAQRIRAWIRDHPQADALRAYLLGR